MYCLKNPEKKQECIWGGPLADLGLQLSGVEEGRMGFGLDMTMRKKTGVHFGAAL